MGLTRKNKRRFKYLLHKNLPWLVGGTELSITNELLMLTETIQTEYCHKDTLIRCSECIEFYQLSGDLGLDDELLEVIIYKYNQTHRLDMSMLNKRPQREGRDNKAVHVGNGGSNKNKVRYPKKNRSKKTWANFYKLFPCQAEKDGWDGKTSKRMK